MDEWDCIFHKRFVTDEDKAAYIDFIAEKSASPVKRDILPNKVLLNIAKKYVIILGNLKFRTVL